MKVLFADPPYISGSEFKNYPNLGLLYIISTLRKKLPDIEIEYLEGFYTKDEQINSIKQSKPDVFAVSFATFFSAEVYELVATIKKEIPGIIVYAGGPMPSADPRGVLECSEIDICCKGEGEETSVFLLDAIDKNRDLAHVDGIVYKSDGKVIENANRPFVKSLDSLPHPAWDLVDFGNYKGNVRFSGKPSTCIVVSRGCPYNCTFCSQPVWKMQKPWVRSRSAENIVEEIDYLYKRGIRDIYIRADEFNYNIKLSVEICNAIKKKNYKDLYFQTNLYARNITEELVKSMAEINCWLVYIGIESANQRVLDGIKKGITTDEVERGCQILKKYKMKILGFFMLYQVWEEGNKLAFETTAEVGNTLKFIRKLKNKKLIDYMSWSFATPYEGSELYNVATKYELFDKNSLKSDEGKMIWEPSVRIPGVSVVEMKKMRREGFILQAYFAIRSGHVFHPKNIGRIWTKLKFILAS